MAKALHLSALPEALGK